MPLPDRDGATSTIRVIVAGDRSWDCLELARMAVWRLARRHGPDLVIIHGGGDGVDRAFALGAGEFGVRHEAYPADRRKPRSKAVAVRNQAMLDQGASFVLAVHRELGASRRTRDLVRRALSSQIPVWLIEDERDEPRRINAV